MKFHLLPFFAIIAALSISSCSSENPHPDVNVKQAVNQNPVVVKLVGTWDYAGLRYVSSSSLTPEQLQQMNDNVSKGPFAGTMLINGDSMLYMKMNPKKEAKRNRWTISGDGQWFYSFDINSGQTDTMHIEELTDTKLRLRAHKDGMVMDSDWTR